MRLLDAYHLDEPLHFLVRHIVERALVFFFQAFAKIFRGDKTCFAVGQVSAGLFAKFNKGGMREANDAACSIHFELSVDSVAVARRYGAPDVRKAAIVDVAA